jgi:hypothetical protein
MGGCDATGGNSDCRESPLKPIMTHHSLITIFKLEVEKNIQTHFI